MITRIEYTHKGLRVFAQKKIILRHGQEITTKTLVDTCAQQLFYIPLKNYL